MENSGNVFFSDDRPEWYLAVGDRHVGPYRASDIYQRILAQEITWAHFVWKAGQPDWKRICDVAAFQAAVPRSPASPVPQPAATAGPARQKGAADRSTERSDDTRNTSMRPPGPEQRIWFLYYNQTQYGPFSQDELNRLILVGRVNARVHAWKNEMPNWERLERLPEFRDVLKSAAELPELHRTRTIELDPHAQATTANTEKTRGGIEEEPSVNLIRDKRTALRAPLVAKILMADEKGVTVGLCRDISIGGMQVLTDRLPGEVGARIRLNVSAIGEETAANNNKKSRKIEPFVAEGVVVRILEDRRGFSFRFEKLSSAAKRAIEQYIDISQ